MRQFQRTEVELDLIGESERTTQRLIAFVEQHATVSRSVLRDLLFALTVSAPLREKAYLTFQFADICGVRRRTVEPFALAGELLMVSALTADDILDSSPIRGGQPSLAERRGSSWALIVSHSLLSLAHRAMSYGQTSVRPEAATELVDRFAASVDGICQGQLETVSHARSHLSVAYMDSLALRRNGLLVGACAATPAIVAERKEFVRESETFGRLLGIALQHRDDILDFIGDPNVTGKPRLQDLFNGQPNLVLCYAFDIAKRKQPLEFKLLRSIWCESRTKQPGTMKQKSAERRVLGMAVTGLAIESASRHLRRCCWQARRALSVLPPVRVRENLIRMTEVVENLELEKD